MRTIVISVPSGAHHRSFLLPMRDLLRQHTDWRFLIITPGAPWSDTLFPAGDYPRDRFAFADNRAAEPLIRETRPNLLITTTAGLDPLDAPLLESAKATGTRTVTFVESWDNIWKMDRVAHGLGKPGQRVVLAEYFLVWNDVMKTHLHRAFPTISLDQIAVTGAPRLDFFGPRFASQRPRPEQTLSAFGLNPSGRVLHLATTELYDHGHVAKAIAEGKRRGDLPADLQLYASAHPGGKLERHKPWADEHGFTLRFSPGRQENAPHPDFRYNPSLHDMLLLASLFKETDVMVNLSSTVALESCLADRPTICAFFGKPWDWFTWYRSMVVRDFKEHYAAMLRGGGIAVARNPRQLVQTIREYLSNPAKDHEGRRRSAEIIATTVAGDASERVLKALKTFVQ